MNEPDGMRLSVTFDLVERQAAKVAALGIRLVRSTVEARATAHGGLPAEDLERIVRSVVLAELDVTRSGDEENHGG